MTDFILPLIIGIFNYIFMISEFYIIGSSIGLDIKYYEFIGLYSIGILIGLIPITISGLGVREAVLIGLFNMVYNVDKAIIFTTSISCVIITKTVLGIIGFSLSYKEGIKKKEIN